MLSQIGRRLGGMSTRRTVAGNVVSPNNNNAAADDASTAAAADESVVDPPAAGDDDLNVDPAAADELFSATGPFARFRPVRPDALQAKVGQVITAARGIYNQGHSNGDGADFEDIPEWARIIFPLFDGNSLRDAARRDHQAIVRAVGGAQAPLGRVQGNNDAPVQLRNERSRNDGDAELRQRVVGNVDIQREQVEGRGDQANRRIARPAGNRQGQGNHRNRNRVRLRNVHLHENEDRGDAADNDYAGRRADDIRYGLESMRMLVNGIHNGMVEQPRRNVRELLEDHREIEQERVRNPNNPDIAMMIDILRGEIRNQHDALAAPNVPANED